MNPANSNTFNLITQAIQELSQNSDFCGFFAVCSFNTRFFSLLAEESSLYEIGWAFGCRGIPISWALYVFMENSDSEHPHFVALVSDGIMSETRIYKPVELGENPQVFLAKYQINPPGFPDILTALFWRGYNEAVETRRAYFGDILLV